MELRFADISMGKMAYRYAGTEGKPRLVLIHGNVSSGAFYEDIMERMKDDLEMIAPDLRCFGDSTPAPIDATRGLRDFSDDIDELVNTLGWDKFALLGWSMGGGAAMQYALDHNDKLTALILEAPLSPFGFSGTRGAEGIVTEPAGLGSGAGTVNPQLVQSLLAKDRTFAKDTLYRSYVKPPFTFDKETEDKYIDSILTTKIGEGMYPGDFKQTAIWPFVESGTKGVCNTMSPAYCNLSGLAEIENKIPILWIRGDSDLIVSDTSMADLGTLGMMGFVPGWPGAEVYPPQPMISQTRYVLEKYKANGGCYKEVEYANSGHGCHLEYPDECAAEIKGIMGL